MIYLHERGVIHRDLKLENFMISDSLENIKLIDFGLSKILNELNEELEGKGGSLLYMAPEVMKGHYQHKCDNWGLGVVLYMLLSGVPPFVGQDA